MIETLKELQRVFNIDYSPVINEFIRWLPRFISGLIVFLIFWIVYRAFRYITVRALKRAKISLTLIELFTKILKYTIFGLAILMMATQWKIEIFPILSTLGVVGIAVGLAAQRTVANMISGIIILVSRPFQEGDWVDLEDTFGRVIKTSLRSTQLLTQDNLLVDIPNEKIVESKIVNHTFNKSIRLRIEVGIAYKESIVKAQEVIQNIVKNDSNFLTSPKPKVVVTEIADSSVNLELHVWIKNSNNEIPLTYELRQKVKLALDEAGIEIPFPHRQLFIENIQARGIEHYFTDSQRISSDA